MNQAKVHRRHAARVAAIATFVVMIGYLCAAVSLNVVVTHHLVSSADARLSDRLEDARQQTLTIPGSDSRTDEDADVDDAPTFVWSVGSSGVVTPLTPGAPALPVRSWSGGPVTLPFDGSTFRFDSLHTSSTTLVAGESLASTANVQSTLLVAELVFGTILAVAVFGGALVVGLRASAPSELFRRRQAEFTADASHELRTPITVIEAEISLALDRPRAPAAYREVLERVRDESTRLHRIVEDLLWLARADDRPTDGSAEVVDVARVVDECVVRFGAVATTHRVELSFANDGVGPFTVLAQADLIDRLAGVLVDNACKFAGETGRVEVSVRSVGARIVLRVEDSGPGIPPEQREAVFDRFHRASADAPGTGLGLAIADSVVRTTHGKWEIGVSDLGGARMEVSWRRAAARRGRAEASQETLSQSLA